MSDGKVYQTLDGNEAVAHVAYRLNEVISIYPITPASPMGEWADAWAAQGIKNIWGSVPNVVEMQSEGGAAGAVHGALQAGCLTTTFTASQGLLLMLPNMYKIAGELTPAVIHVAARSLAAQALSIFGDHSDVTSVRASGFGFLCSGSVQEAMDFSLISQAASLESRVPFVHFFDGFRTSHEVAKVEMISDDIMRKMIGDQWIADHRKRSLNPENPVLRGTAQNPDVYFQGRETVNKYYDACPEIVQNVMDRFASIGGRKYNVYEYYGHPQAERLIILMGSGAEAVHETADFLINQGEKVGLIKIRLFRPFNIKMFVDAIPETVNKVAVLDRTKEPGSAGEPLYQDIVSAVHEGLENGYGQLKSMPKIIGGRYGLSSKEFTPAMIKGIYDHLAGENLRNHFTIGIKDDVTNTDLPYDVSFSTNGDNVVRAMFYGLGSDGTVGANKNSIKIIGENTDNFAQGYFVYDSKKAGATTVSHLRFGPDVIRSTYLISRAGFIGCHQPVFLESVDMLSNLVEGGTFLLNTIHSKDQIWNTLPKKMQEQLIAKKAKFYVIDASKVAKDSGMGKRINTIMQVCFFGISGVLPKEEAIEKIKDAIKKTYGSKGDEVVQMNLKAVDSTLECLYEVTVPSSADSSIDMRDPIQGNDAPEFVKDVLGEIIAGRGDQLPVSAMPDDGTFPTATTKFEKRGITTEVPSWEPDICIQCGKCAFVCPHAAIRIKAYDEKYLTDAPSSFKVVDAKDKAWAGMKYTIQVTPLDCTGCTVCVDACPAHDKTNPDRKAINMVPVREILEVEKVNWQYFLNIPDLDREKINPAQIKQQQVQRPLFEFSGACSGCGETPYIKLVTQLYGDRALVANATGCSSIYGGNLPTTPYCKDSEGRGPTWSNSLFEDNAEFGLGMRLSVDKQRDIACDLLQVLRGTLDENLVSEILSADQSDEEGIGKQRQRIAKLKQELSSLTGVEPKRLASIADYLVNKSVWIIGGDGWAYDIGYGGLDHVLASGENVNILVLDTEVYSNTGGQMSKSTPRAAIAKFAAAGKPLSKKDLGMIAMSYKTVYVASVAMGAKDQHTLKAFIEAEKYDGPSIIIAYSPCIAHGINLEKQLQHQKAAVETGQWLLYRYNPDLLTQGKNPFSLDSRQPKRPVEEFLMMESRFKMLTKSRPEDVKRMFKEVQDDVDARWQLYSNFTNMHGK